MYFNCYLIEWRFYKLTWRVYLLWGFEHFYKVEIRIKVCFLLQNPKKFEDVFDEMIYFLEQTDHWDNTEMELAARGVSQIFL